MSDKKLIDELRAYAEQLNLANFGTCVWLLKGAADRLEQLAAQNETLGAANEELSEHLVSMNSHCASLAKPLSSQPATDSIKVRLQPEVERLTVIITELEIDISRLHAIARRLKSENSRLKDDLIAAYKKFAI